MGCRSQGPQDGFIDASGQVSSRRLIIGIFNVIIPKSTSPFPTAIDDGMVTLLDLLEEIYATWSNLQGSGNTGMRHILERGQMTL